MHKIREATLDAIKKVVEANEIDRVVYMHADHFEPWRLRIDQRYADELVAFSEQATKSEFSRRLSLFYKPQVTYVFAPDLGLHDHIDDEPVGFLRRSETEKKIAREAMRELLRTGAHEVHAHIHHEGFTLSDVRHDPNVTDWIKANSNTERDARRFELYLQLGLVAIREDTGLPIDRWAFVHGNWALNASDRSICRIPNELSILKRNGCFGDFTFPAGRSRVNPRIKHPFTCIPQNADRAYDVPKAAQISVLPASGAFSPERFFIWSSVIKHDFCALDYYGLDYRINLPDSDVIVQRWIEDSVHFDGTVYIKTHAHSMMWHYWEGMKFPIIPHLHPNVQTVCSQVAEACARLGLALEFGTAGSIYDEMVKASDVKSKPARTKRSPPARSAPKDPEPARRGRLRRLLGSLVKAG